MERIASVAVPRVAQRAFAALPAARPAAGRDPSFSKGTRSGTRGFAARGRGTERKVHKTHKRWQATPSDILTQVNILKRNTQRPLTGTPRAIVDTETTDAETSVEESCERNETAPKKTKDSPVTYSFDNGDKRESKKTIQKVETSIQEAFGGLRTAMLDATKNIQAKTRAATHPPLPVVSTFEELLRFARIASLNSATEDEIAAFFEETNETVTVLDMVSVKQRVFIATDDKKKRHTVSFRGTTNLTNVVQNIRLSNNPVVASGRLASVGRSLSGAFAGLQRSNGHGSFETSKNQTNDPSSSSDSDSGSFDEDDADVCQNIDWSSASPDELRQLGCTDHLPMHRGYRLIARECADALAPFMKQGYSVQLTGHSLGGAVAVATALLFRSRGASIEKVVTFGAPKLGPRETREAADRIDVLRVVQKDDLIPLLPMSRPFVRKPYVHLGEGIVLDNDAPGRYARLTREWGTAGILWKQRKHLGYARGGEDVGDVTDSMSVTDSSMGVTSDSEDTTMTDTYMDQSIVSSDEPDVDTTIDEAENRGRFFTARSRLRKLRTNLSEGVARRRAQFTENRLEMQRLRDAMNKSVLTEEITGEDMFSSESNSEFQREVAAWASGSQDDFDTVDNRVSKPSDGNSPAKKSRWSLFTRGGASAGASSGTTYPSTSSSDPAPFDDVEGELFVRVAETTEGGAESVAAAAADEWERASIAADDREYAGKGMRGVTGNTTSATTTAAADDSYLSGPTIFEELWRLRKLDAETRGDKLESHRMLRYVSEIEKAIDAGPVQTSLAGVYTGKEGDEIGLDFDGEDDGQIDGGTASWMTWSR